MLLVLQRWIGAPDFPSERAGIGLTSLKRKRSSKMLIIQCPSLALQACGKRLPRHRWHSRRRLIQRRSINWRDAASAACDCFAGVLGTRSPDHARGYALTPRDPGLRNPRTSTPRDHEPCQRMQLSPTLENAPCSVDPSQKRRFCSLILHLGTESGRGQLLSRTQEISAVPFTPRVRLAHATLGKRISGSAMKVASGQSSATPTGQKMKKMGRCLQLYPGPTRSYRKRVSTTAERPQP